MTLRDLRRRLSAIRPPRRTGDLPIEHMSSGEMRAELTRLFNQGTGSSLDVNINAPLHPEVVLWAKGLGLR